MKPCLYNPANTHQRCFSQFDRKTDCFDGGPWALESTDILAERLDGDRSPEGMTRDWTVRFESVARLIRATFKAVCVTQTRHGVSVNKYQAGSPKGQKSGIGVAAVSPVPVRGSDQEEEISTCICPIREKP
jgi:hypothetical protein